MYSYFFGVSWAGMAWRTRGFIGKDMAGLRLSMADKSECRDSMEKARIGRNWKEGLKRVHGG